MNSVVAQNSWAYAFKQKVSINQSKTFTIINSSTCFITTIADTYFIDSIISFRWNEYAYKKIIKQMAKVTSKDSVSIFLLLGLNGTQKQIKEVLSIIHQMSVSSICISADDYGHISSMKLHDVGNYIRELTKGLIANPTLDVFQLSNFRISQKSFWRLFWAYVSSVKNLTFLYWKFEMTHIQSMGNAFDNWQLRHFQLVPLGDMEEKYRVTQMVIRTLAQSEWLRNSLTFSLFTEDSTVPILSQTLEENRFLHIKNNSID